MRTLAKLLGIGILLAAATAQGKVGKIGAALLAKLPVEEQSVPYVLIRVQHVSQDEMDALFAQAQAAVYLPDRGEVILAVALDSEPLPASVASRLPGSSTAAAATQRGETLGVTTLPDFLTYLEVEAPELASPDTVQYLMKFPAWEKPPEGLRPPEPAPERSATASGVVVSDGFENGLGNWQLYDSSSGKYTWGVVTCDKHSGNNSVDAVRGGSRGRSLSCSADFPANVENWLVYPQCINIYGASQAWAEAYLHATYPSGVGVGLYFGFQHPADPKGYFMGYYFPSNMPSCCWVHVVTNLRQWIGIGDLAQFACNRLEFGFRWPTEPSGFGARIDDVAIYANQAPSLTCSLTATPQSGPPPLTVSLVGSVTGMSTGTSYMLDFGDGSSEAYSATATHTYQQQGLYFPFFGAEDNSSGCGASATVAVGCNLNCNASAPPTSSFGVPVTFTGTATANGCSGYVSYDWDFGDASPHGTGPNATHTYAAPSAYVWKLTASANGNSCSTQGSIVIGGNQVVAWVPVVSHSGGAGGAQWRSDTGFLNRSAAAPAHVALLLHASSGVLSGTASVPAGGQEIVPDVAAQLGLTNGSAALEVHSDQPLVVTSRTYNQQASGLTYGQGYDGLASADCLAAGQSASLPQLTQSGIAGQVGTYRTNVGITNAGATNANVTLTLYDLNGNQLWSDTRDYTPGQFYQYQEPYRLGAGRTDIAKGYAKVIVNAGSGVIAYASVIDNASADPTTINMKR
ncbi:MAG: PKD domain-containing protein [Thermoanaerobaculales bacterium]